MCKVQTEEVTAVVIPDSINVSSGSVASKSSEPVAPVTDAVRDEDKGGNAGVPKKKAKPSSRE